MPSVAVASMPSLTWNCSNTVPVVMDWPTMTWSQASTLPLLVEADARAVQVHGAVVAALDVVLAAPQRAHRRVQAGGARGLGDLAGLDHEVAACSTKRRPKPPPAICTCTVTCSGLRPSTRAAAAPSRPGHWRAGPQLGAALGKLHGAVQRLHRRVGEVREHELGFQLPGRCAERRHVGVELARAGLAGQLAVLGQLLFAVDLLDGRRVPLQLQRVAALLGRPVAVGHHGHAFGAAVQRHAQHGLHALDGARRAVVHRGKARAEHRRARDHGRQLAGQANVDAEVLSPAALGARVEARRGAADDAEVLRDPSA